MNFKLQLSLFVLLALGGVSVNGGETEATGGSAKLLVSKRIQNKYLVEGMDVVIHYGLYNVGDNAATDVVLSEVGSDPTTSTSQAARLSSKSTGSLRRPTTPISSSSGQRNLDTSTSHQPRSSISTTSWMRSRPGSPQTLDRVSSFHSRTTTGSSQHTCWTGWLLLL